MAHLLKPFSSPKMLIAYFSSTQDWRTDQPTKHIPIEEARDLRDAGAHYFADHGRAIVEVPRFMLQRQEQDADNKPICRRWNWRVVNQTAKPGVRHKETRLGPGNPSYALV